MAKVVDSTKKLHVAYRLVLIIYFGLVECSQRPVFNFLTVQKVLKSKST